ncbi:MAG: glycosyltransferase [Cytophagaceae bacterium]
MNPLVTIIALSYNHASYIQEALESVYGQSYDAIELIIIDNASTDDSVRIIKGNIQSKFPTQTIFNNTNEGICKAFNRALQLAKGKYIIDFSLDDKMHLERVTKQVMVMELLGEEIGVSFTDVELMDENSKVIGLHSKQVNMNQYLPVTDWFDMLVYRYIVNPVGVMIRTSVLRELNGYDELLSYEDFDFWIRSSLITDYYYIPDVLSSKRIVSQSLSLNKDFTYAHAKSTLTICKKIVWIHLQGRESVHLTWRLRYEWRNAWKMGYKEIQKEYLTLLKLVDPWYQFYGFVLNIFH